MFASRTHLGLDTLNIMDELDWLQSRAYLDIYSLDLKGKQGKLS